MTGFVKRVLPHTSNSLNLEDHNLAIEQQMELKLFPTITLCWHFCWPNFNSVAFTNLKFWIIKVGKLDVWKTPFYKSGHICKLFPKSLFNSTTVPSTLPQDIAKYNFHKASSPMLWVIGKNFCYYWKCSTSKEQRWLHHINWAII